MSDKNIKNILISRKFAQNRYKSVKCAVYGALFI